MRQDDRDEFARLLASSQELYREPAMSQERAELFFAALGPYSLEQVRNALMAHVRDARHGMFFPKPADLVRQIEGTDNDRALDAWAEARRVLFRGADTTNQRIRDTIALMGGKERFRMTLVREEHFVEERFRDVYETLTRCERLNQIGHEGASAFLNADECRQIEDEHAEDRGD